MIAAEIVLSAMLKQPQYFIDRAMSSEERIALYWPIAVAIAGAARNTTEAAALVTLGWHESRWARYVVSGHCSDGPRGARCDSDRIGVPRARGAFQLHRAACPIAYAFAAGTVESLNAEARCALNQLRFAMHRCRGAAKEPWAGAFSGYGSPSCSWPPATKRADTMRATLLTWGG